MHMDESTNSIPSNELDPRSASDQTPAVADPVRAEFIEPRERAGPGQQPHSDPTRLRQNQPRFGASVAVYCGSDDAVALGFRVALSAMATASSEEAAEPRRVSP
jgi:hypothetical protein